MIKTHRLIVFISEYRIKKQLFLVYLDIKASRIFQANSQESINMFQKLVCQRSLNAVARDGTTAPRN